MRHAILCLTLLPTLAAAQQPVRQQKILTPEQIAYQQQLKTYRAQVDTLRASANQAFTAEAAREKAPACPNAETTLAINDCLSRENDLTEANYQAFTSALRDLLALPAPRIPGVPYPLTGPSGPEATPDTSTAAFNASETAFNAYAKAQCAAVDTEWRGGTIVNSVILQCRLRQTRNRLREEDTTYSSRLHPH